MFSLLALLDDIATTLDDVASMTKVAIEKTSALMSDDLAVNSGVVVGVNPDRELPMVKAIFLGSLLNKVYCIVGVLGIMAVYPPILKGVLLIGGLYLSYEGAHAVIEKIFPHSKEAEMVNEKKLTFDQKVKGAIRTDLILSIEIIVIAKDSVTGDFITQAVTLAVVGLLASVLIYGLVAVLVKIDDVGLYLVKKDYKKFGMTLVRSMPYMMKGLGIAGTTAMFLVGGGIITHTFHIHSYIPELIQNLVTGGVAGVVVVGIIQLGLLVKRKI